MRPRGVVRRWALAAVGALALAPASVRAQTGRAPAGAQARVAVATFASGCFWCSESDFEKVPGVVDAVSGYTGGRVANPTYEQVSRGGTGHREAVQVFYDPSRVNYSQLLDAFWRNVDPVDPAGQFCDKGEHYTSAIYVANAEERRLAEAYKHNLAQSGRIKQPIATAIVDTAPFYKAEEYHQSYYKKNPIRYKFYRTNCGRDRRLEQVWGGKS